MPRLPKVVAKSPLYGKLLVAAIVLVVAAALAFSTYEIYFKPAPLPAPVPMPSPSPTPAPAESQFCSGAARDFVCPKGCPPASDADCCIAQQNCWMPAIGCVKNATQKTDCLFCQPKLSQTDWSNKADNSACTADSNPCTSDACGNGECVHASLENGTACPSGACCGSQCQPVPACTSCQSGPVCENGKWACKNKPAGTTCQKTLEANCTQGTCDGSGTCSATVLPGFCFVQNACFAQGAENPSNGCQKCAPDYSRTAWQAQPDASACKDDGNECTSDSCLGGACGHVAKLQGTACGDDGLQCTLDFCSSSGQCTHAAKHGFCLIEGKCFKDGDENPSNACQYCDAAANNSAWAAKSEYAQCGSEADCGKSQCVKGTCTAMEKPDGTACSADAYECTEDVCRNGACSHEVRAGCLIGGACVADGNKSGQNQCLKCSHLSDPYNWTVRESEPCSEDSLECTKDLCNAQAQCTHPDKDKGASCSSDSNPCTSDECDGGGACTHPLKPEGTRCSPTNRCNANEICKATACDASGNCAIPGGSCYYCSQASQNLCKTESCNGIVNYCTNINGIWRWTTEPSCDDSDSCTKGDACSKGNCRGADYNPAPECGTYTILECPQNTNKNLTQINVRHYANASPTCGGIAVSAILLEDGSKADAQTRCENNTVIAMLSTNRPGTYQFNATDAKGVPKTCTTRRYGSAPAFEFPDFNALLLPLLAIAAILLARRAGRQTKSR
ncbi:MAG: hypothetical protein WC792_01395 [Candidatus Micrarchaeia archaeon]|jgi:hypothetical protein